MNGKSVVAAARRWIGTPYHHQASLYGVGCDCLGLVRGVWRETCGSEPETTPAYSATWDGHAGDEQLTAAFRRWFAPVDVDAMQPGDVLIFRMKTRGPAKHLGILAENEPVPTFVHAYQGANVVEGPLTPFWRKRIVGVGRMPEPSGDLTADRN